MDVPQPSIDRIVPAVGRPLVVGIVPGQPEVVVHTAATWAQSLGGVPLVFAYVDTSRITIEEFSDGSVRHSAIDPDTADDSWKDTEAELTASLSEALDDIPVSWRFVYLAGRPDRSLTHLARAVDAPSIVVGARRTTRMERGREFFGKSIAQELARHQHRPVLIVPTAVVDWKTGITW